MQSRGRGIQPVGQSRAQGLGEQQVQPRLRDGGAVVTVTGGLAVEAEAQCRLRFPVRGVLIALQAEVGGG